MIGQCARVQIKPLLFLILALCGLSFHEVYAVEKDAFLVEVSNRSLERNDSIGVFGREIDRTITLRARIKNTGFKPKDEGKIGFAIYIRKWGTSETESIEVIRGEENLPALLPAKETFVELGEYRIGGHMHGTSKRHMDEMLGWKITLISGAMKTELESSSKVSTWDKRAKSQ
jgi:hypothetical protein